MLAAGDISLKHSFTLQLRWHKLRLKLVAKSLVCLKSLKMQLLRKVLFPTRQIMTLWVSQLVNIPKHQVLTGWA